MNNQRGPRSLGVAGTSTSKAEDRGGAALSPRAGASSRREDESPVAAGESAAGCRQHVTAGLASCPAELGRAALTPRGYSNSWHDLVPLPRTRAVGPLLFCRAQVLVQKERQAEAFICSLFRLVEILPLMSVALGSGPESLQFALNKPE